MAPDGTTESAERNYYCTAGHLVLITVPTGERVRAVYCRSCGKRVTVYLTKAEETRKPASIAGMQVIGNLDPRNPPIEAGPVRPVGGRG